MPVNGKKLFGGISLRITMRGNNVRNLLVSFSNWSLPKIIHLPEISNEIKGLKKGRNKRKILKHKY